MLAVFVVLRPRNVKIVLTPLLLSPVTRSVDRVTGESNAIELVLACELPSTRPTLR